ncbi:MAG: hypothetical protein ABI988_11340 [Nitrospirota bacterium]
MRRFLFAAFLAVACATGAAAGPIEDAFSAFDRQEYTLAAQLLRPLAKQGNARAQVMLGNMYDFGVGVPQNFMLSYMWLNVGAAASTGDLMEAATKDRDKVALKMAAAQIEKAQEMARRCQQSKFMECD